MKNETNWYIKLKCYLGFHNWELTEKCSNYVAYRCVECFLEKDGFINQTLKNN